MDRFRNKQTGESYYIEFDFTSVSSALIISSATVSAKIVSTGVDVTATITTVAKQLITSPVVYVWVTGGTDGVDYQITCKATASNGSVYELEGLMLVADVPLTAVTGTGPGCVVKPIIEPLSLAEIKSHLRVDDSSDDEMLSTIIQVAREQVEDITRRALLTSTWDFVIQEWPVENYIKLPYGNLQSVTSVKWKDTDGVETTLTAGTDYLVETNGENVGRVVLPYGESWPSDTLYPSNPITIRFVCGWTAASLIPAKIKAACKLIAGDIYQNREGKILTGQSYQENKAVMALLTNARIWDEI